MNSPNTTKEDDICTILFFLDRVEDNLFMFRRKTAFCKPLGIHSQFFQRFYRIVVNGIEDIKFLKKTHILWCILNELPPKSNIKDPTDYRGCMLLLTFLYSLGKDFCAFNKESDIRFQLFINGYQHLIHLFHSA